MYGKLARNALTRLGRAGRPLACVCGQLLERLPTAAHEERDTVSIVWLGSTTGLQTKSRV
jgi:hypothetical protein